MKSFPCTPMALFTMIAVVTAMGGCSDDPSSPAPEPEEFGTPRLVVEPEQGYLGTVFEAHLEFDGAIPSDLGDFEMRGLWPDGRTLLRVAADDTVRFQTHREGFHELAISIFPPDDRDDLEIVVVESPPLEVFEGSGDGSLDLVLISEGLFLQGWPERRAFGGYDPQREVHLSTYFIGRTEVTNATFVETLQWALDQNRLEVREGQFATSTVLAIFEGEFQFIITELDRGGLYWDGSEFAVREREALRPARGVTWLGAAIWCNWLSEREGLEPAYDLSTVHPYESNPGIVVPYLQCDFSRNGYRLPTEAEWEKASRGGLTLPTGPNPKPSRWYPWDEDYLIIRLSGGPGARFANVWDHFRVPTPVGSFPDGRSPYGLDDMIGNVSEWVHDWMGYSYYEEAPDTDPRGPERWDVQLGGTLFKVWRGAPFSDYVQYLETGCSSRFGRSMGDKSSAMGFRVARGGSG